MSSPKVGSGGAPTQEFEYITPISLQQSRPQGESRQRESTASSWLAGFAFAALLIVLAAVFFLLPKSTQHLQPNGSGLRISTSRTLPPLEKSTAALLSRTVPDSKPWQRAELARERGQAENALAILMQKQAALQEQAVGRWGGQRFAEAQRRAAAGDEFFLDQDYRSATVAYAQSAQIFDELADQVDNVLNKAINAGQAALANGHGSQAATRFALALAIDPENTQAKKGLIRAENLDEVQRLLSAGARHEDKGALQAALRVFEKASRLDPDSKLARDALNQITHRIGERKFNQAMSEGFTALENKRFEAAREAFRTAREIKPDSAEAADGLVQVDLNVRLAGIEAHQEQAAYYERQEDWQAAAEHYRAALKLDPNLVFAKRGQARALARAQLAWQLDFHIEHPERLSSDSVYAQAISARDRALEIEGKSPRLQEQLTKLSELLTLAATPVRVRLESDNQTEVAVYNVGQLGTFDTQELELRPGDYTAVGSRDGYRDVRREFTVIAGQMPPPVVVRCEERI